MGCPSHSRHTQEIGIASMDLRFIDAKPLIGVYHSIYDTPFWIEVRTFYPPVPRGLRCYITHH